jgi:hypothetical protein
MTIHKIWRLCSLTVATLFWTSCSTDSNPQFVPSQADNADSSADVEEDSSSSESSDIESSESSDAKSSSAEAVESSSSADKRPTSSSETSTSSSSGALSSSESVHYVLAKDTSVTCEKTYYSVPPSCLTSGESLSCDDYKKYLGRDTSVTETILNKWEEKLESCGAIVLQMAPLYGISYPACNPNASFPMPMFTCSNDSSYKYYVLDGNQVYRNRQEYNEAFGISSSSVPESSSSSEAKVQSCKQEDFALFADILAEVQKDLYKKIVNDLVKDASLTEAATTYLESLLDRANKTLKGNFAPYYSGNRDVENTSLEGVSAHWFDGYIAKTKTCPEGSPEKTERYQEKYDAILSECIELIGKNSKAAE